MNDSTNDLVGCHIKITEGVGIIKHVDPDTHDITVQLYDASDVIYNIDDERIYSIVQPVDDLLLASARDRLSLLTFRRKNKLQTRQGWHNEEFFFGFTKNQNMLHADFRWPPSLYYQAGDYCNLKLEDGVFEFEDNTINQKISGKVGDFMCGIAGSCEQGARYYKWFYCGTGEQQKTRPFYNLYLLIQYGADYYIFRGRTKKQILDMLYCSEKKHLYQAYALVIYYKEPIPAEYGLPDLEEKIKTGLLWMVQPEITQSHTDTPHEDQQSPTDQ